MADRRRVVQVLNNLFSNAARHAPESSPIRVEASRDGVHVAVSVRDQGQGIAPERLPHLFRKHVALTGRRRRERRSRQRPGARHLQGAGGGAWGAHPGGERRARARGACFTFTLPLAEELGGGADSAPRSSRKPRGRNRPVPILVVDDDPETLRFVRDALSAAGYAPVVTGDPKEVPGLVRERRPHLILLDLMLPDTDGIDLMESVPELAELPVIFISAYGRDETIARALESGAADYLVKPFSPTELTARVGAALRRRSDPEAFVLGDLVIDYGRRRVKVAGRTVALTVTEYELLRLLSLNAGTGHDERVPVAPAVGATGCGRARTRCATSSRSSAASSATVRASPSTSSTSAGSVTACRDRTGSERCHFAGMPAR